ncbi:UNVERIFIED_CONTAM: hypothetical protein H355_016347, partial [Colinus virginianus]
MRGLTALLTETSLLDPQRGITYRGYTIEDLIEKLPRFDREEYPPVEGVIWLLLTAAGASSFSSSSPSAKEAAPSSHFIPHYVHEALDALPSSTHPMTQLVAAVTSLQPTSRLAAAYHTGTRKDLLWKSALYDALSVAAMSLRTQHTSSALPSLTYISLLRLVLPDLL